MSDAERIARRFHETYEALAPDFGYRTREASAKPWDEVPATNRGLMTATVQALLDEGTISARRKRGRFRSAIDGLFVSRRYAREHPDTTVREQG